MNRCPVFIECVEDETAEMLLCLSFGDYYWLPKKDIDPRPVIHECEIRATIPVELARRHGLIATPDEMFEERAAIMEFDGGLTRDVAERHAAEDLLHHWGPQAAMQNASREPSRVTRLATKGRRIRSKSRVKRSISGDEHESVLP